MTSKDRLKLLMRSEICDRNSFEKFINKSQKKYTDEKYPTKSKNDSIQCIICGGRYTRSLKCIHDNTRKHQQGINDIYDYILS
jgi:hypothetical protein